MIEMKDDGASPCSDVLTLRDYFASAAMQGILAGSGEEDGFVRYDAEALAEQVYVMANAMLEARKK
jgi:hypothetical protein